MTLADIAALVDERTGSRKATCSRLAISRQRLHHAIRGGPPLRFDRLLRLGMAAGVDPADALRAGGRPQIADLIEEAYGPRLGGTTVDQRLLLTELEHLPQELLRPTLDFLRRLGRLQIPASPPAENKSSAPAVTPKENDEDVLKSAASQGLSSIRARSKQDRRAQITTRVPTESDGKRQT